MRTSGLLLVVLAFFSVLSGCSSLTLEQANFAWPVESVLAVNSMNMIEDGRYALVVNVTPLAVAEFQDSTALWGTTLRLIRNAQGYYFVTGPRFKRVYVFRPGDGTLDGTTAIEVSTTGLTNPALNQRPPHIELLDGTAPPRYLTNTDIAQERRQ
ncbi:MAG: hypothetical protein H6Q32_1099 [Bacteroidetes bacterium]|nr:hypothetical protein [Bacteroidota bacterium]